jgi:hypothetical protein
MDGEMEVRNWDNQVIDEQEAEDLDEMMDKAKQALERVEVAEVRIRKRGNAASELQKKSMRG